MRLAIVNLTAGGASGGHLRFAEQILPRLAENPAVEALLCAAPPTWNIRKWVAPHPKMILAECRPFSLLRTAPDKAFKKTLDNFRPDVVFMAYERRINYPGAPVVAMVQNMAPLVDLKTTRGLVENLRLLARRREAGHVVQNAAAVIVPTAFVKEAVTNKFSIAPEKIAVINFGSTAPTQAPAKPGRFPGDFSGKFLFTAGSLEYYRGLEDIIDALPFLKAKFKGIKLAVAGGARAGVEGYQHGLMDRTRKLGVSGDVLWLGNLNDREMSWCYLNCAACAVTSRVESFCMVALEALSHGCLCVSTNSPCLPEIFGPGGRYYKAGDAPALERELERLLDADAAERVALSAAARQRAQNFSWDKSADLIVKFLTQCLTKTAI